MFKKVKLQNEGQSIQELLEAIQKKYQEEEHDQADFYRLYHQSEPSNGSPHSLDHLPPQKFKKEAKRSVKKLDIEKSVQENSSVTSEERKNHSIPEEKDVQTQKKERQMLRNRISAQNSRDRKKLYVQNLEMTNDKQQQQILELQDLLTSLEHKNDQLQRIIADREQLFKRNFAEYETQLESLVCLSCGSKNIGHYDDLTLRVASSRGLRGLGYFGVATLVVLAVLCTFVLAPDSKPPGHSLHQLGHASTAIDRYSQPPSHAYPLKEPNETEDLREDDHLVPKDSLEHHHLSSIIDKHNKLLMEYYATFNYRFDQSTLYRGIKLDEEHGIVEGMMRHIQNFRGRKDFDGISLAGQHPLAPFKPHKKSQPSLRMLYFPHSYQYSNQTGDEIPQSQDGEQLYLFTYPKEPTYYFHERNGRIHKVLNPEASAEMVGMVCRPVSDMDFIIGNI